MKLKKAKCSALKSKFPRSGNIISLKFSSVFFYINAFSSEIEKRIQEKEEEFENTRKNHQRAMESMQATLEAESKGKAEALRIKKKLESDINVIYS